MNLVQKYVSGLVVLVPILCFAGPPFITDDPNPVSYQHVQIIPFTNGVKTYLGDIAAFPALEIDYGIAPRLEINTIISYLHVYSAYPSISPSASGLGDTQLGLKYAIVEESAAYPQIAFAPIYYIPTGDAREGLGNGKGWYQLPIWLQRDWGKWSCYGGGGFAVNSGAQQRNYFFGGVVLQKQLTEKWLLGGEIFSQGASSRYINALTFLNLGGIYNFNSHLQGLFSLGHTILGTRGTTAYLGLQWNS